MKVGRLDLVEALVAEVLAHREGDLVAQLDLALHREGAQVDVAVLEAEVLLRVALLVDHEGQGLAAGEDLDRLRDHLDLAGLHVLVDHVVGPGAHAAADGDAVLELELGGGGLELVRGVGLDDHLGDPVAVPEVDEGDGTVVPLAVYPSVEHDALAGVGLAERSAGSSALLVFHARHSTRARRAGCKDSRRDRAWPMRLGRAIHYEASQLNRANRGARSDLRTRTIRTIG